MSDAPRGGWQCPSCGRHVPRHVDVCRCGSERLRLEALGYTVHAAPPAPSLQEAPARRHHERHGLAARLVGYRVDRDLGAGWRTALRGLFMVAVMLVGAVTARFTHTDPPATRENVLLLTTLEAFTRTAGRDAGNTIPAFLASAGAIGALAPSGAPEDPVRAIEDVHLRPGFCSQNVARQVRHEYPGYYDDWPDERLERTVLAKYPEYADRLCVLPSRLDAAADEVVKYELKPRSFQGQAGLWLRTLLVTALFGFACLNAYYRVIVGRLAPRRGQTSA